MDSRFDLLTLQRSVLSTFEFWLELAWLWAKCKDKTLPVIEIFVTVFNTALSQSSIFAQYPKKDMIKFSQQPVTKQQKIVFPPVNDFNLEGYKIKFTLAIKFSRLFFIHFITI